MIKIQKYTSPASGTSSLHLTNKTVNSYITKFWSDVYSPIINTSSNKHLMILVKVQYSETILGYRTLGHLRKVNYSDKELFTNYIVQRLNILNDSYSVLPISDLIFSYIIRDGLATLEDSKSFSQIEDKEIAVHRFNNINLPVTMDPYKYGDVRSKQVLANCTRYIVQSITNKLFEIDVTMGGLVNNVTLLGGSDLKWIDTTISGDLFKREIQKSTIYFLDGEVVLRKAILSAKPFKKTKLDSKLISKFITLDIETIKQGNQLIPYLICAYNGYNYITSYIDSTMNQTLLFSNFLNQLLTFFSKSGTKLTVYAHNLGGFDGVFLMKHLLNYGKVKPLIFNGRIVSLELKLNVAGYLGKTILFKDSYQLLPYSLRSLCEAFNINLAKGWFPYLFTDIFYKGVLPLFEYWNITLTDYQLLENKYLNLIWSFRDEALKYCKLDCLCLHQILTIFNEIIYKEFKVNIHNSLTLPSLAMRIYKTLFMPENTIYQLLGKIEKDIRESYTGGAVDVYIPHNRIGSFFSKYFRKLYSYDVNSLYPTVMAQGLMPVGLPVIFEGDIRAIEPNAFGFFYCKITSPTYLEHPLLQRRINTSEGIRTVAGLGTWDGWISSIEMDNAIKYGYSFMIIRGYEFKAENIFKTYVERMYELRLSYPKGTPMNLIAKLLMNSLYGKLGMKDQLTTVEIFKFNNDGDYLAFEKLLDKWGNSIHDWIVLDNHIVVIRDKTLSLRTNPDTSSYHGSDINIAIAAFVTSYARCYMSYFKNNPDFHLYYSDTDSIVIDSPLSDNLVGKALGQVKLEHIIKNAVFLAPKVYGLITDENKEIIKVKGVTPDALTNESITFDNLTNLLIQNTHKDFTQEKWHKSITKGTITVSDIAYTLKVTANKRKPLYVDGYYENTTPYFYNEIEVVKNNSKS